MKLPNVFYAEPRVNADSPNYKKLKGITHLVPGTPETDLVLALDYYKIEAFATAADRDEACGRAANRDVCYFPIRRSGLDRSTRLDQLGCGHSIDHPGFEQIFSPIFSAVLRCLITDAASARGEESGAIAAAAISIARARYTISIIATGEWRYFTVEALTLFENIDRRTLDRTIEYLNGRLMLELSPSLIGAVPN